MNAPKYISLSKGPENTYAHQQWQDTAQWVSFCRKQRNQYLANNWSILLDINSGQPALLYNNGAITLTEHNKEQTAHSANLL